LRTKGKERKLEIEEQIKDPRTLKYPLRKVKNQVLLIIWKNGRTLDCTKDSVGIVEDGNGYLYLNNKVNDVFNIEAHTKSKIDRIIREDGIWVYDDKILKRRYYE